MFITFEGIEGSGKTTQIPRLVEFLEQAGYIVVTTREPGGTAIGDQIRDILLDLNNTDMQIRTEVLLFQASRAQLVEQVIRPSLAKGFQVISDRYADSTLAYQGYGYQLNLAQLQEIVHFATGGLKPDLTLLLDVDVEEGLRRRFGSGGKNRLDAYDPDFYHRVRQGYHLLAQAEPQRWVVIDARRSPDQVQGDIRRVVHQRLGQKSEER